MFKYYVFIVLIMSLLTVIIYTLDKIKAINNKYRISEFTLLVLSGLGGAIGGIFSMYIVRHKNRHIKFIFLNWLFLIIQISVGLLIYFNY